MQVLVDINISIRGTVIVTMRPKLVPKRVVRHMPHVELTVNVLRQVHENGIVEDCV